MLGTKRCCRCKSQKEASCFNKNKSTLDGMQTHCRTCQKAYTRKHRATEKCKETRRRYRATEKFKAYIRECNARGQYKVCQRRYRTSEHGRVAHRARNQVHYLVNNGVLPKPTDVLCSQGCGQTAVEYHHHHGYLPPHETDVIPVCLDCHAKIHRVN